MTCIKQFTNCTSQNAYFVSSEFRGKVKQNSFSPIYHMVRFVYLRQLSHVLLLWSQMWVIVITGLTDLFLIIHKGDANKESPNGKTQCYAKSHLWLFQAPVGCQFQFICQLSIISDVKTMPDFIQQWYSLSQVWAIKPSVILWCFSWTEKGKL